MSARGMKLKKRRKGADSTPVLNARRFQETATGQSATTSSPDPTYAASFGRCGCLGDADRAGGAADNAGNYGAIAAFAQDMSDSLRPARAPGFGRS